MNKKGYTLVEILVVISIIGFLVAAAVYAANMARIKSRDAKRLADINSLAVALKVYYNDNKKFPGTSGQWYINNSCDASGYSFFSSLGLENYIKPLPNDPSSNQYSKFPAGCYWYEPVKSNEQGFILLFHPEGIKADGTTARPYLSDMGCYTDNGGIEQYYCIGENW